MPQVSKSLKLSVTRAELATILAALRYHQAENLHDGEPIADLAIGDIATDGGTLKALDARQIDRLCERLNMGGPAEAGLRVDPPHDENGDEPLWRVVYIIDVNGDSVRGAAEYAHQIMVDPKSMRPVLHVIDPRGSVTPIDLSENGG